MSVRIVTDSTADLPSHLVKELGITVVPLYVRFGEKSYRDGVDINYDEFYTKLVNSPVHPTTSQPTPSDFAHVYRELSKDTDEIVSIHISKKLSGTYNSALQGKEFSNAKSNITVIDSESVTMGVGLISALAGRLAIAGENVSMITDEITKAIKHTHLLGVLDTLKYLALGGRIGKAKALLGSVLNVKPVITMREGEIHPVGNLRTHTKGIEKLYEFVKNTMNIQEIAVIHNTTPDEALGLKNRFASLVTGERLHLARLGPALGVHGGPNMMAVVVRASDAKDEQPIPSKQGKGIPVPSLHLPKLRRPQR